MKPALLYGLGTLLIIGTVGALLGRQFLVALICMPISVVAIRAAGRAPPNPSRATATPGWLLGFLATSYQRTSRRASNPSHRPGWDRSHRYWKRRPPSWEFIRQRVIRHMPPMCDKEVIPII